MCLNEPYSPDLKICNDTNLNCLIINMFVVVYIFNYYGFYSKVSSVPLNLLVPHFTFFKFECNIKVLPSVTALDSEEETKSNATHLVPSR